MKVRIAVLLLQIGAELFADQYARQHEAEQLKKLREQVRPPS